MKFSTLNFSLLARSDGKSGVVHALVIARDLSWATGRRAGQRQLAKSRQGTKNAQKFFVLQLVFAGRRCLADYPAGCPGRARTTGAFSPPFVSKRCSPKDAAARSSSGDVSASRDDPLPDFRPRYFHIP